MNLKPVAVGALFLLSGTAGAAETGRWGVELAYTHDNNVSRGGGVYRYEDKILSATVSYTRLVPVSTRTRLLVQPLAGVRKFQDYDGLSASTAGINLQYQWRPSSGFHAPTLSLLGSWANENFNNRQRDARAWSLGVSARSLLTDRIGLSGALLRQERDAESAVFDTRINVLKLNLDYEVTRRITAYLGLEQHRGDTIVSAPFAGGIGRAWEADNAFTPGGLYAYRFDGKTQLLTLGVNLARNEWHAFDVSARWIDTNAYPGYDYRSRQVTLAYLGRF
jgi:hypothetical protein